VNDKEQRIKQTLKNITYKKMKTKIIIITVIVLAITSCRKYPEGGSYFLTDMSKKISGNYNFIHYYVDGIDSADYYFNNDYIATLQIYNNYKNYNEGLLKFEHISKEKIKEFWLNDKWEWADKKKTEIILKFMNFSCVSTNDTTIETGPFRENISVKWKIKKLKDKELFMECDYAGKHYRIELKH